MSCPQASLVYHAHVNGYVYYHNVTTLKLYDSVREIDAPNRRLLDGIQLYINGHWSTFDTSDIPVGVRHWLRKLQFRIRNEIIPLTCRAWGASFVQLERAYIESDTESESVEQRGEAIRQVPNTPTALNSYAVLPPIPAPYTDEWDFLHVTSSDVYNNQSVQNFVFGSAKIVSDTFACLFKQMQSKEGIIVLHKGYTILQQAFASYQSSLDEGSNSSFNEVLSSGGIDVIDKVYLYFRCAIDSFQSQCLEKNGGLSTVSGGGGGEKTDFTQYKQETTPLTHHSSYNWETTVGYGPHVPTDVLIEKLLDRPRVLPKSKGVIHDRLLRGMQFLPEMKDSVRRILKFPATPQANAHIEHCLYYIFSQPILKIVTVRECLLSLEKALQSLT